MWLTPFSDLHKYQKSNNGTCSLLGTLDARICTVAMRSARLAAPSCEEALTFLCPPANQQAFRMTGLNQVLLASD